MTSITTGIQILITLKETNPPIFRRVIIANSLTFLDLHSAIQISMGWRGNHLFEFLVNDYSIRNHEDYLEDLETFADAKHVEIDTLLDKAGLTFNYVYDFGDHWVHQIVLEKVGLELESKSLIKCLDAEQNCPPDDSGGVHRYYRLLEILNDPSHPEHDDMKDWVRDNYDSRNVSLRRINNRLKKLSALIRDRDSRLK